MREITVKLYQFDELSDKAKERAREWFREGGFDYEWYDFIFEDAKKAFVRAGFDIRDIFFSGFWSQGDGACFVGRWDAQRAKRPAVMKKYAPKDKELHRIANVLWKLAKKYPFACSKIERIDHHYSHENCAGFETESNPKDSCEPELSDEDQELLKETARDAMRWIYKRLQTEYEYQMADAQVDESIRANEYEFLEDGKRA